MTEYSLGLLKPDCARRRLTKLVLKMVQDTGLEIVTIKKMRLKAFQVEAFYKKFLNENFFSEMSLSLQSGSVTIFIVKGKNAINVLNELVGSTEPRKAKFGTIRHMGTDIRNNLAHSSGKKVDFIREAKIVFSKQRLRAIKVL